jgi:hypothetical protein
LPDRTLFTITVRSVDCEPGLRVSVWIAAQQGRPKNESRHFTYDGRSRHWAAAAAINAVASSPLGTVPRYIQESLKPYPPKCDCCGQVVHRA